MNISSIIVKTKPEHYNVVWTNLIDSNLCDVHFGEKEKDFNLLSTENKKVSLDEVKGENGTLIMFICNHCPYVKAVIKEIVQDVKFLESQGIKSAAIMSNDVKNYPEDSFENMITPYKEENASKRIKEYLQKADLRGVEKKKFYDFSKFGMV